MPESMDTDHAKGGHDARLSDMGRIIGGVEHLVTTSPPPASKTARKDYAPRDKARFDGGSYKMLG